MASAFKVRRGTRAALNIAAAASQLTQFEPLFITDENRLGIATSTNAYATAGIQGEGGGANLWVGLTQPSDPVAYPFWLNADNNQLYAYKGSEDGFVNISLGYVGNLIWSDTTAPAEPLKSPFWYNTTTGVLSFYPNSFYGWIAIGGGGTTYEFALAGLGGF